MANHQFYNDAIGNNNSNNNGNNNNTNDPLANEKQELNGFYSNYNDNKVKLNYGCLPPNSLLVGNTVHQKATTIIHRGSYFEAPTNNNKANHQAQESYYTQKLNMDDTLPTKSFWSKWANIKGIGLALFFIAAAFSVYLIITLPPESRPIKPNGISGHIRLVSLFQRHGDRSDECCQLKHIIFAPNLNSNRNFTSI